MTIQIRHKRTGGVIIEGEYNSLKECLEQNEGTDLRDADLRGTDLTNANLRGIDLRGANLRDADLRDADLEDADLRGTDLEDANLQGAENYVNSHDVFTEVIRCQPVSVFIEAEWTAIAQICLHRLCWNTIKTRFSNVMPHIFAVLANAGFAEWAEYWKSMEEIK